MERLKSHGITRYEILQGLSGVAPGSEPVFACVGNLYFNSVERIPAGNGGPRRGIA